MYVLLQKKHVKSGARAIIFDIHDGEAAGKSYYYNNPVQYNPFPQSYVNPYD